MRAQHIGLGKSIFRGWGRVAIFFVGAAAVMALSSPLSTAAAEEPFRFAAATFPDGGQSVLADTFAEKIAASASRVAPAVKKTGYGGGPGSALQESSVLTDTYAAAFAASAGSGALPMPPSPAVLVLRFDNGSAQLTGAERREIAALASEYGTEGSYFRVVGHASSRTRDLPLEEHVQVNFNVSLERANKVAAVLMHSGVTPQNMSVEARADSEPIYYESMPAGEAGNRRVEIYVQ